MKYTREKALDRIRELLAAERRGNETTCHTAGRLGIFCHGYDQWDVPHLRRLYPEVAARLPEGAPRSDLLALIMAWDESRMLHLNAATTCDAKIMDESGCRGFDRFSNQQLKKLFPQLFKPGDSIVSP